MSSPMLQFHYHTQPENYGVLKNRTESLTDQYGGNNSLSLFQDHLVPCMLTICNTRILIIILLKSYPMSRAFDSNKMPNSKKIMAILIHFADFFCKYIFYKPKLI